MAAILPPRIGALPRLKVLSFSGCARLQQLPATIGNLMECLDLSNCDHLQRLPASIDALTSLRSLKMLGCTRLERLPTSMGRLLSLTSLDLSNCMQLMSLPESICRLRLLKTLKFHCRGCKGGWGVKEEGAKGKGGGLERLPLSIGALLNLEELDLAGCQRLLLLPPSLTHLVHLRSLNLSGCRSLTALPALAALTSLETLSLSGCKALRSLPESICRVVALEALQTLRGGFVSLPEPLLRRVAQLSADSSRWAPCFGGLLLMSHEATAVSALFDVGGASSFWQAPVPACGELALCLPSLMSLLQAPLYGLLWFREPAVTTPCHTSSWHERVVVSG